MDGHEYFASVSTCDIFVFMSHMAASAKGSTVALSRLLGDYDDQARWVESPRRAV